MHLFLPRFTSPAQPARTPRVNPRGTRLRVLLVLEATLKGTGRHVMDLAEMLLERGADVHLLYSPLRADRFFHKRLKQLEGLSHSPIPMRRSIHPSDLTAVLGVRRYLREHGPFDVIHGHSSKGGAVSRVGAMGSGVPAIYTPHGMVTMDPDLSAWKRQFYRLLEVVLSWMSARVIAVSPEESRACVDLGMSPRLMITIPNGVGVMKLTARDAARQAQGLDADAIVVGSVGRLVEDKAPSALIRAFAVASRRVPELRLLLTGDGPLMASLVALADELQVSEKIVFTGELPASAVLDAFDVFAISSRKEGLPYAVLEAMSAGLPVVATNTSGVELLVHTDFNGIVVPPEDVDAFADALVTIASDAALRTRMGEASLRHVGRFTPGAMVDQIVRLYRESAATEVEELEPESVIEGA